MSMDAILEAAATQIQTVNNWTVDQVDVQPEGRPPASMGDFYVALDEASVASGDKATLKEAYTIEVAITLRIGDTPADRLADAYRDNRGKLGELERKVIAALHTKQAVRQAANAILAIVTTPAATHGDQFQLPLYYLGRGRTAFASGEWAGSDSDGDAFMVRKLNFGGALRVQDPAIMK